MSKNEYTVPSSCVRWISPVERYIQSLPGTLRVHPEETYRLKAELVKRMESILCADAGSDGDAQWVRANVELIAFRWSKLVRAATRWVERNPDLVFPVGEGAKP